MNTLTRLTVRTVLVLGALALYIWLIGRAVDLTLGTP